MCCFLEPFEDLTGFLYSRNHRILVQNSFLSQDCLKDSKQQSIPFKTHHIDLHSAEFHTDEFHQEERLRRALIVTNAENEILSTNNAKLATGGIELISDEDPYERLFSTGCALFYVFVTRMIVSPYKSVVINNPSYNHQFLFEHFNPICQSSRFHYRNLLRRQSLNNLSDEFHILKPELIDDR